MIEQVKILLAEIVNRGTFCIPHHHADQNEIAFRLQLEGGFNVTR